LTLVKKCLRFHDIIIWGCYNYCLFHPTSYVFNILVSNNKITCNSRCFNFQYEACSLRKSLCLLLRPTGHKTSASFNLIFSDAWDPAFIFLLMAFAILLFLSMCTPNIYDIILLLRNLMYFFFHRFQALLSVNFC